MKSIFAISASALALATSLGASAPAQAQDGNLFSKIFGGGVQQEIDETGTKAPGPMPGARKPAVLKNAAAFLEKHGCKAGDAVYFRVYKLEGLVDVLAQCGGANAAYKLLETWRATETNGVMQKLGYKLYEGDHMVPEGMRTIYGVKDSTNWYLGINFGYPDALDRSRPLPKGKSSRGGLTLFHGPYGSKGCVPLSIAHIELAYGMVDLAARNNVPTYIDIFPTKDMSAGHLKRLAAMPGNGKYLSFWQNMAEMDQSFQQTKIRRNIVGHGVAYAFADDVRHSLVAVAPAEILRERVVSVDIPEASPKRIPAQLAALPPANRTDENILPAYNKLTIGPPRFDTGFKQAPVLKYTLVSNVRTASLSDSELSCMFAQNAACEIPNKENTFYNPKTDETKVFKAGKGDSLRGFIPVTDSARMADAEAWRVAFKPLQP